jgi:hypothetical protein
MDAFRKHFPHFPKGRLIKSESPDFILKTSPKHSIGIELTALPSASYSVNNLNFNNFISDIHLSILKKEEKLNNYRKIHADEYWLIIYADSIETSAINLNNYKDMFKANNCFHKVFLFQLFEQVIFQIEN